MSVIEVQNLKKHYGKIKAVDGISFSVEKGEIFGFLGPNGAGKTTTIRTMMDFIRPTAGSISILGRDSVKDSVKLKEKIGYLSGRVELYGKWTGKDHIDFVRKLNGKKDIANELIKRLDFNPNMKAKQLSTGNRQKLGIIMALMLEPEVLILDEPTVGLDPLLQNVFYDLLEEQVGKGATVFVSSHNLPEVERICGRVGIIKQGKIIAIEYIRNLQRKRMHTVEVHFESSYNKDDFANLSDVEIIQAKPEWLLLNVTGDPDAIIRTLARYNLRNITIEHASLEQIFLEFYEKN